jgi:hypothetical protein
MTKKLYLVGASDLSVWPQKLDHDFRPVSSQNGKAKYREQLRETLAECSGLWVHCEFGSYPEPETFIAIIEATILSIPIIITSGNEGSSVWSKMREAYATPIEIPLCVATRDLPLIHHMIVAELKGRVR